MLTLINTRDQSLLCEMKNQYSIQLTIIEQFIRCSFVCEKQTAFESKAHIELRVMEKVVKGMTTLMDQVTFV